MAKPDLTQMQDRIAQLEDRIGQLIAALAATRPLLEDSLRLEDATIRVGQLAAAADTALLGLQERAKTAGVGLARSRPTFDTVHRAEVTGYVSLYFVGGRTNKIELLVGREDPPTDCVGELNTTNGPTTYVGGIVRQGEYWTLVCRHGNTSGYQCVFTPLF